MSGVVCEIEEFKFFILLNNMHNYLYGTYQYCVLSS